MAQRLGQRAANDDMADDLPAYAELHCLSDSSFLRGAASAEALFLRAAQCGYAVLAITDEWSLAGIVRGLQASRAATPGAATTPVTGSEKTEFSTTATVAM